MSPKRVAICPITPTKPKATPLNNVALVMDVPNPLFAKFKNAFVACNAAEIKSLDITLFAKSWKAALTDVI